MILSSTLPATGNTRDTQPENGAYFPALDGIRAFAFLLVFFHHYCHFEVGWTGVDVFFVLSGFLITGILYDTRDTLHRARNFYVRRSLRIFPLYYAVALVFVLLWPVFHWQWNWGWITWPLYLANWAIYAPPYAHGAALSASIEALNNGWLHGSHNSIALIGHFWSLCVEEQFYLFWPWVVFKVRSRRALIAIASAIIVVWPLLRHLADLYCSTDRLNAGLTSHGTFFRLDTLMVGALIALLYRGKSQAALFRTAHVGIRVAVVVTVGALIAFAVHPSLLHSRAFKPILLTVGFTVIALFAGALIVSSLQSGTPFYRVFSNRLLRWLGRITYGAYVFHDIPHLLYARIATALHVPLWPLALVCTFSLAWLSFRFLETPFLNLKARFTTSSS
jgi:peptidoglycan/LPS O-acetylase OafA/YrhL